jgi:hypothetical protein
MARLYAATGDRIARLEESGVVWTVEQFLEGTRSALPYATSTGTTGA